MESRISNKKLEELRKSKQEEKQKNLEDYSLSLDEEYREVFSDEFYDYFSYFKYLLDRNFIIYDFGKKYNDFVEFVIDNSNDLELYKEEKLKQYLDEETEEEEMVDDSYEYEFLQKDKGF